MAIDLDIAFFNKMLNEQFQQVRSLPDAGTGMDPEEELRLSRGAALRRNFAALNNTL